TVTEIATNLPGGGSNFKNPFDKQTGDGAAYVDAGAYTVPLPTGSTIDGIVAYADSNQTEYQVAGRGKGADLTLVLTSGQ
ncbi:MAG: hypothetical protein ABL977_09815, partial [Candidatus Eisenbacteria bacterium]